MQLPDLSLLLVMVVFWATYFVLRASVFRPLGAILAEREKTVKDASGALGAAVARRDESLADLDRRLTDARREAMAVREAARARVARKRADLLEASREEARKATQESQLKLESEIGRARAELEASARETAVELASFVLGRKVA